MAEDRLRACQENAAHAIVEDMVNHLCSAHDNQERRYGFVAPTGAGKTLTTSMVIKRTSTRLDGKVMFIYLTLGKGDLDGQVRDKMTSYMTRSPSGVKVMNAADACLKQKVENILIVESWDALNKTDKNGKAINSVMKEVETGVNFPQLCELARQQEIPIVLIIDEVHAYAFTEKSLEIRHQHIQPTFTLEVSATPKYAEWHGYHRITFEEAKKSGLVKKHIIRNTFLSSADGIIEAATKLQELLPLAEQTRAKYNPRMLIFLPNGEDELDSILIVLESKFGWSEASGEVVIWMSKRKSTDYLLCKDSLGKVKVIITKEAIDTGVDIPAIQVIAQLRPTSSVSVEVQKLGRGLRMPEQHHYGNGLDSLYFFVFNDHKLDYEGAEYLKEVLDKKFSMIKPVLFKEIASFHQLPLSYYERICPLKEAEPEEFSDIFSPFFSEKLKNWFTFNFDSSFSEEVRKDGLLDLDSKKVSGERFERQTLSNDDVDSFYHQRLRTALKHLYKHLECIEGCISEYLDTKKIIGALQQQIFTLNNFSKIEEMLSIALYESEEKVGITKTKVEADFMLPAEYWIDGDIDLQYQKMLHDKYFVTRTGRSAIETSFESLIDKSNDVKWWLKNYDCQYGKSFSVCYIKTSPDGEEGVFFPDYIVMLTNGKTLIVDTKAGTIDANEKPKKETLLAYLKATPDIIGGMIKQEGKVLWLDGNVIEPLSNFIT